MNSSYTSLAASTFPRDSSKSAAANRTTAHAGTASLALANTATASSALPSLWCHHAAYSSHTSGYRISDIVA